MFPFAAFFGACWLTCFLCTAGFAFGWYTHHREYWRMKVNRTTFDESYTKKLDRIQTCAEQDKRFFARFGWASLGLGVLTLVCAFAG